MTTKTDESKSTFNRITITLVSEGEARLLSALLGNCCETIKYAIGLEQSTPYGMSEFLADLHTPNNILTITLNKETK